jgi:hypothetical protein
MSVYDTRDRGLLSESTHGKREANNRAAVSASTVRPWDKHRAPRRRRATPAYRASAVFAPRPLRSAERIARTISSARGAVA